MVHDDVSLLVKLGFRYFHFLLMVLPCRAHLHIVKNKH